jgi:hypothetical protein
MLKCRLNRRKSTIKGGSLYEADGVSDLPKDLLKVVLLVMMNANRSEESPHFEESQSRQDEVQFAFAVNDSWSKSRNKKVNLYLFEKEYGLWVDNDNERPTDLPLRWSQSDISRARLAMNLRHQRIQKYLGNSAGSKLMFLESQLAAFVAQRMMTAGFPFILIHDGFLTVAIPAAIDALRAAMFDAFEQVMGVPLDEAGVSEDAFYPPPELMKAFIAARDKAK